MSKRSLITALCFELPRLAAGEPLPTRLTLLPAPDAEGWITGIDGRRWKIDPVAVAARWTRPRAITENHARVLQAAQGGSAPAYCWINSVSVEPDKSITFEADWTPLGVTAITNRAYRWLSPEFLPALDDDNVVYSIQGAGLTNDPNFTTLAINSEQDPEPTMSLKAVAISLGLPESADEAAVLAAIGGMKASTQVALNAAQTPDPTKWVTMSQHQATAIALNAAQGELATIRTQAHASEVKALLDSPDAVKRITPASRGYYETICNSAGGLEIVRNLLPQLPIIAGGTGSGGDEAQGKPPGSTVALNAEQKAICTSMGISEDAFRRANGMAVAA